MAGDLIQVRANNTLTGALASAYVALAGEPLVALDTGEVRHGDGVHTFAGLPPESARINDQAVGRVKPAKHAPGLGLWFPEAEGAAGDGTADDTAAVIAAFTAANAQLVSVIGGNVNAAKATVQLRGKYNLATLAGPIIARCHIIGQQGTLVAPVGYARTVLLIGHDVSGQIIQNLRIQAPNITKPDTMTSLTPGSCAVQIQNVWSSDIVLGRNTRMETGVWLTGLGQGSVYNRIHLGITDLCKVGLKMAPQANGWVNQNKFVGGNIAQSQNTFDGGSTSDRRRPGWRHVLIDGSAGIGTVNVNNFAGISFEGDLSELHHYSTAGECNTVDASCRFEQGIAAVSVTLATDTFTAAGPHGLAVGDGIVFTPLTSRPGGMFGAGYQPFTYHIAAVPSSTTFTVAETRGGPVVSFSSNGSGVVYYPVPRIVFDGATTVGNRIEPGCYAYPGPLDVRQINGARDNGVQDNLPRLSPPAGRNRIINGDFRINQRGYVSAAAVSSGAYTFDRWKATSANTILTFTAALQGQQMAITAGSVSQVVEQANMEAGTYTLSWLGHAQGRVYRVGTTAPGYAKGPVTVDLDGTGDVMVEFTGSNLQQVQLERGIIGTPFEQIPVSRSMVDCQRYFQRLCGSSARAPLGVGAAIAATLVTMHYVLTVQMRAAPTLTVTNPAFIRVNDANSIQAVTAIVATANGTTPNAVRLDITTSGATVGHAVYVDTGSNGTAATLDLSAEL